MVHFGIITTYRTARCVFPTLHQMVVWASSKTSWRLHDGWRVEVESPRFSCWVVNLEQTKLTVNFVSHSWTEKMRPPLLNKIICTKIEQVNLMSMSIHSSYITHPLLALPPYTTSFPWSTMHVWSLLLVGIDGAALHTFR